REVTFLEADELERLLKSQPWEETKMKTKLMMGFIAFLILAMPFAFAAQNETNEQKANKEYPTFERALDRIKLLFAMQVERKLELINKIQEKRQQHYQFLIEKGKTDQAEKFSSKTIGIVRNFDQWKANKQDIISKLENKSAEVKVKINDSAKKSEVENKLAKVGSGY
ncbi:MAG: hypothetical protein AABW88_00955, partial [Nanoarchaeota archaeon]